MSGHLLGLILLLTHGDENIQPEFVVGLRLQMGENRSVEC